MGSRRACGPGSSHQVPSQSVTKRQRPRADAPLNFEDPPYRGRWEKLSAGQQAVNRSHAKTCALGEQAMATLKTSRLLRKLWCSTTRITNPIRAVLTLHLSPSA